MHFLRVAYNIRATFSSRKCKTEGDFEQLQQKFSPAYHHLSVYHCFFFFLSLVQSKLIDELSAEKERRLSHF